MVQSYTDLMKQWHKTHDDRAKMQHVLLVCAVTLVIVAGLISLVNYGVGQTILFIAGVLFVVFFTNAIIWALVHTFVFPKLRQPTKRSAPRR